MYSSIHNIKLVSMDGFGLRKKSGEHQAANIKIGMPNEVSCIQKLSGILEKSVQSWLADKMQLIDERILKFAHLGKSMCYQTSFIEIDAVSGSSMQPELFIEIKYSINQNRALSVAKKQISRNIGIVHQKWPKTKGCIILMNKPANDEYVDCIPDDIELIKNINALSEFPFDKKNIPCLKLDSFTMWNYALDNGLCGDTTSSLWEMAMDEADHISENANKKSKKKTYIASSGNGLENRLSHWL